MATHTLSHFYPSYVVAIEAMADLVALGIPQADISLIESENDARLPASVTAQATEPPARVGAKLGFGIGAGLGALVGVGAIRVPLLAPLVAFGWLLPTLMAGVTGAMLGALLGVATRMGVTDRQAHAFAEGLQRGEHLLLLRVDSDKAAPAQAILDLERSAPRPVAAAFPEPPPYDTVPLPR